ncbi:MAG TPA: isoprenyl transferase [Xanthomonadales bacterium]|nr:isoprenyl transferase [Xanthomonadales bacterium]
MSAEPKSGLPAHIAIVMDGNGRWAEKRSRPRTMGHQAGLKALRRVVEHCGRKGISELTVFAFSSENWKRPETEVSRLMELFMRTLNKEAAELHKNNIRIRFIGDLNRFQDNLRNRIDRVLALNPSDYRMTLNVAANYGGRWDITHAARLIARDVHEGKIQPDEINETLFSAKLATAGGSEPDLLIRTGGEMRISNFLLWQAAYSELYFSSVLWPDFDGEEIDRAIEAYSRRERRYGAISKTQKEKAS